MQWPEVFAIPVHNFPTIAKILVRDVICRHGCPERLLSDRGGEFLRNIALDLYKELGIQKVSTSSYHPQTDGMVERFNGTFVDMISMYINSSQTDWDVFLPYCLFAYRTSVHPSINESPFYMVYGRDPKLPIETHLGLSQNDQSVDTVTYKLNMRENLNEAYALARRTMNIAAQKSKWTHDSKLNKKQTSFEIGDRVWIFNPATSRGKKSKLEPHWFGPLRVAQKRSDKTYRLEDFNGKLRKNLTHRKHMKLFKPFTDPNEIDEDFDYFEQAFGSQEDSDEIDLTVPDEPDVQDVVDLSRHNDLVERSDSTSSHSTNDDERFEIEQVLDSKFVNNTRRYLVKWKGYDAQFNSWVDADQVQAPKLLAEYNDW